MTNPKPPFFFRFFRRFSSPTGSVLPRTHPTYSRCARISGGPGRARPLRKYKLHRGGPGCGSPLRRCKLLHSGPGRVFLYFFDDFHPQQEVHFLEPTPTFSLRENVGGPGCCSQIYGYKLHRGAPGALFPAKRHSAGGLGWQGVGCAFVPIGRESVVPPTHPGWAGPQQNLTQAAAGRGLHCGS